MIAAAMPQLRGVNMGGGNFSYLSLPPASGTNYQFPSTEDIDYVVAKGANCIRLVVSWEGLQDALNATLGSGGAAYATYLSQMEACVAYATGKGAYVIIEPHGGIDSDFAAWKGNAVGTAAVPNTAFANFWGQMAALFAANGLVIFGLSNEPCRTSEGGPTGGGGVAAWFTSCNAAIAAIRSNGFLGLVMVPGQQFTAASQWLNNWYDTGTPAISNMTGVAAITDSANNWCVSAHMYLNANQDGTTTDIGVTTTIAAGSNGLNLPQATINLASAAALTAMGATAGRINVTTSAGTETVTYTGITGNALTGCTGGTGTMHTGGSVTNAPFVASLLLEPLIAACRSAGVRMHLSEFGVQASTAGSSFACADLLQLLNSNQDVCLGMAWWISGPQSWYVGANFTLCPSQGNGSDVYATDSPQMALAQTFWQGAAQDAAQEETSALQVQIASLQAQVTAAQAAANTALTNAASAQSTANTAVTDAAAAQSTANSAATAASAAAAVASAAESSALAAESTANAASTAVAALTTTVGTMTPGSGPTSSRPTGVLDGTVYVDTTLGGVPIFAYSASSTGWVNSGGTAV